MAEQGEIFLEWVNACNVLATPIQSVDELSDGLALGRVLNHFLPERFTDPDAGDASTRLQMLCTELDTHLNGKLTMMIQADVAGAATGNQSALLFRILEAVVLASVEGPRNQEAVGAILTLSEEKQHVSMAVLQNLMQMQVGAPQEAVVEDAGFAKRRESFAPMSRQSVARRASHDFDAVRSELHELQRRLDAEANQCEKLERDEKTTYQQLQDVRHNAHHEEDTAAEYSARLAMFKKQHGDEFRKQSKDFEELRYELQEAQAQANNLPKEQERMERLYQNEVDEANTLRDRTFHMEKELEEATNVDLHDSDHLKKELADYTAELTHLAGTVHEMSQHEMGMREKANEMIQEYQETEDLTFQRENTARMLRQRAVTEQEHESDVLGLLMFKESEMQQVVDGLARDEANESNLGAQMGAKKSRGDAVLCSAADMLRTHQELVEARLIQNYLEKQKREAMMKADRMDLLINRLESQVKDPVIISQTRIMAEEVAQASDFGMMTRRKNVEKDRLNTEVAELKKIQARMAGEEETIAQLRVKMEAETGLTESTIANMRTRLGDAEAREKTEIQEIEEREKEREAEAHAAQEAAVQEASQAAAERAAAAAESAAQQAEAVAAAAALAAAQHEEVVQQEAERAAAAHAAAEQAEAEAAAGMSEEAAKEAMASLKDELLLREKQLYNIKKQCDERRTHIRKEARLMNAVLHDLSMRYHQLSSQHTTLSDDLEHRGL